MPFLVSWTGASELCTSRGTSKTAVPKIPRIFLEIPLHSIDHIFPSFDFSFARPFMQHKRMHRCACSTRALETILSDFAGLSLRSSSTFQRSAGVLRTNFAVRSASYRQQNRGLRTSPAICQLEDGKLPISEDGEHIPFHTTSTTSAPSSSVEVIGTNEKGADGDAEGEWHADIKIFDAIPSAQKTRGVALETERSRTENSLLRKARRVEEGKCRPLTSQEVGGEEKSVGDGKARSWNVAKDDDQRELRDRNTRVASDGKRNAVKGGKDMTKLGKDAKLGKTSYQSSKAATSSKSTSASGPSSFTQPSGTAITKDREAWQIQKDALDRKFGETGWQPRKRLSPDALEGIRTLHASDSAVYNTPMLADHFQVTPEAIRRILKSKWRPSPEESEDRLKRWEKRGVRKWQAMADQGVKPPKRWRQIGVTNPMIARRLGAREERGEQGEGRRGDVFDVVD